MTATIRIPSLGANGLPVAPVEIQDAVELYARKSGRHGKIHFVPMGGWMVRFTLRENDPRMVLYQQGQAEEPPSEDVWFHKRHPHEGKPDGRGGRYPMYLPLNILDLGVSGVVEFLEKTNTWSGRGEHNSLEDAVKQALNDDVEAAALNRKNAKDDVMHDLRERRRHVLDIPVVPVAVDLKKEK